MKKKLLVIIMILVIATVAIFTTACNSTAGMISKNQERDLRQNTATASYANRNAQVDKLELNATINNFVYQYYNYYQQGYLTQEQYQQVLENIGTSYKQANESLAETEAYTLKCIDELYKRVQGNGTEEEKAAAAQKNTAGKAYNEASRISEIESVLPKKDLIAAVEAYNEEMQKSFDSYREAYEKEIEKGQATTKSTNNIKSVNIETKPWKLVYEVGEEENLSGLKVSVTYNDDSKVDLERSDFTVTGFSSEEAKDAQEITVTFGNTTATYTIDIIAAKPSRPVLPTEEEEEEKTVVPALFENDLEEKIAAADKDEAKILKEAKRRLEKQMTTNYRSYQYYYLAKLKTQVVTAYEEIVGGAASVTLAEINEYYAEKLAEQVEQLTLKAKKYSEIAEGADVKTQIVHEDGQYFYVQNLLVKISSDLQAKYDAFKEEKVANDDALELYLNGLIDQTGVYISNVAYDKDATCEDENCTCTACANYKGENPGPCTDENCTCKKCPNKRYINEKFAEEHNLTLASDGTINVWDVLNVLFADLGTVGTSEEDRAAMLTKFKKWTYMLNEDDGAFTCYTDGKLGYSVNMETSSYEANFTDLSRALAYGSDAEKAEWHVVGTGVGSYGWCYTSYGIHVVMLSGYALENTTKATDLGNGQYALPADSIVDYTSYEKATEGDLAKGTLIYDLKEKLLEDKKNDLIGSFKKDFYQKEMKENAKISYYEKTYKDLVKQYKTNN